MEERESELVNKTDAEFFKKNINPIAVPALNGLWDIGSGVFRIPTLASRLINKDTYLQNNLREDKLKRIIGYSVGALAAGALAFCGIKYSLEKRNRYYEPLLSEIPIATNCISLGYALASRKKKN